MMICTTNELSSPPRLIDVVTTLAAFNMDFQASDDACQARDALANNATENCRYARGWQTVQVNYGRSVSGSSSTATIMELARENDVVIATTRDHVRVFDPRVPCVVWSAQQITSYTVPIAHDVGVVWVDSASTLSTQVIDNIYMTYAGRAQQFVFVG